MSDRFDMKNISGKKSYLSFNLTFRIVENQLKDNRIITSELEYIRNPSTPNLGYQARQRGIASHSIW